MRYFKDKLPINLLRIIINLWGPFLGAGIKITKISADYRLVKVSMKLTWFNTNYVGTHFGGSIYAMTDPFYMFILIKNLGNNYVVWDKAAQINFLKPGRGTLHATFTMTKEEIKHIRQMTKEKWQICI